MKILEANRERKVSSSELADWFGIAYSTYRSQKKKRLEELKGFCDYDEVYGGVIIKEVYFDEYYKYQDDENRVLKVINDKYFNMDSQGKTAYDELNSISGIAKVLQKQYPKDYDNKTFRVIEKRVSRVMKKCFGVITKENPLAQGGIGVREYVWAIKLEGDNNYRYKTREEDELFKEIIKAAYAENAKERIEEEELLKDAMRERISLGEEVSFADYENARRRGKYYVDFKSEVLDVFREKTSCLLVRATRYEVERSIRRRQMEMLYGDNQNKGMIESAWQEEDDE